MMSGRIDFTLDFNKSGATQTSKQNNQYRIYILGSFSGRSDVHGEQRKIIRIDNDSFDQVMAKIMPTVELDGGLQLSFETVEDFHPDIWMNKVKIIADLQVLKRQLSNPATAAQAAAKIKTFLPSQVAVTEPDAALESQDDMLQRLLGKKTETTVDDTDTVDRLIKQIVTPFVSKTAEPQYQNLIEVIDQATSQCLQAVMHNLLFQSLESLWIATQQLVNEELADEQSFYLVDISQDELMAEQKNDGQMLIRKLLQHIQAGDDEPNVLLVADFDFSAGTADRDLLGYCNDLAKACGGYFLSAVNQAFIKQALDSDSEAVSCLQKSQADRLLMAYPRYLLRLPYGMGRDPIEAFGFEECSTIPQNNELLWGCPAFIVVRALIRTSQDNDTPEALFFNEVPAFSFEVDGEPVLQPGTELVLTESQANELFTQGIMPLIGYRQRRGVRLLGITCIP